MSTPQRVLTTLLAIPWLFVSQATVSAQTDLFESAQTHMEAGAYAAAVEVFERLLEEDPEHGVAWFRMGMAQQELEDWGAAADSYNKAIEFGAQVPSARWRLGRVLSRSGNVDAAIIALEALAASGFGAWARITDEPDLEPLRTHERYPALLQRIQANADPCRNTPINRQFDFWVGEWDVVSALGQPLGENRVELVMRDCALVEHWTNVGGRSGTSINVVDGSMGVPAWRQLYVSDFGGVTDYRGGVFENEVMTLEARLLTASGDTLTRRMRFMVMTPDSIHQLIDDRQPDGSWSQQFFGVYLRKGSSH